MATPTWSTTPANVETDKALRVMQHERFWKYVNPEPNTGCWLWSGWATGNGYGCFYAGSQSGTPAHRFAYELAHGPIPHGLHLDHLCRVKSCVNPLHLEAVTPRENWRRGGAHRRSTITHCKRGHEFAAVGWLPVGPNKTQRDCRACRKFRAANRPSRAAYKRAWRRKKLDLLSVPVPSELHQ